MEDEKNEDTIDNPVDEGTTDTSDTTPNKTEDKPQDVDEGTTKKPEATSTELEEKNKRLYARMKKAEEGEKLAKEALAKKEKEKPSDPANVFDLAKTVSNLRDYNSDELDFIQMMSKAKNITPEEAAKTEEAKLYISARRLKVEAEKSAPEPSTKQTISEKPFRKVTPEELENMPVKEKEEYLKKMGLMK